MNTWAMLTPSMIFHNGIVHTVDCKDSLVEAVAISENRIIATGTNEEILAIANTQTEKIDLNRKSLIPGIIDTHAHPVELGLFLKGIFINGIPSINDLKDALAEKLSELPAGTWLQGGCFIETQFVENRMPTRYDLDMVEKIEVVGSDVTRMVFIDRIREILAKENPEPEPVDPDRKEYERLKKKFEEG